MESNIDNFKKIFWDQETKVDDNSVRNYNNIKVITLHKSAEIADNVFLRNNPTQDSQKYIVFHGENNKDSFFLPIGFSVEIICRTANKVKINDWENYWYFVNIKFTDPYSGVKLENSNKYLKIPLVWVYGEFLKIKK